MSIPDSLKAAQGNWSGEARLHLHEEPIRTSPSRASVALVAGGKFASISYDWVYEGATTGSMRALDRRACSCSGSSLQMARPRPASSIPGTWATS